jgi:hypothetical protein
MCTSHIDCQELWQCPQDHVAQFQPHSTFPWAVKRSGGLDIRKEIDQLNRDDLGALLEQIIFFVISDEVHWCHAVSVVFFFFFSLSPQLYQKRLAALSFY